MGCLAPPHNLSPLEAWKAPTKSLWIQAMQNQGLGFGVGGLGLGFRGGLGFRV